MEIVKLTPENLAEAAQKAADVMERGGLIIYPTDTVYGIGVDAYNPDALKRLKKLKGREEKRPLSIIVPSVEILEECGVVSDAARALAEKFLPGPLTLVLPAHAHMPQDVLHVGGVGVRVPDDAFPRALARAFGRPYTATSANLTRLPTPKSIPELVEHFAGKLGSIDLIIDDGERAGGVPSTVVSFMEGGPYILREGILSRRDLGL